MFRISTKKDDVWFDVDFSISSLPESRIEIIGDEVYIGKVVDDLLMDSSIHLVNVKYMHIQKGKCIIVNFKDGGNLKINIMH